MKRTTLRTLRVLIVAIAGIAFFMTPRVAQAQGQTCVHQSTQARVQPNRQTELTQSLTIKCGESFIVGSFHNDSGVWATDTIIDITGPDGSLYAAGVGNGATIGTRPNVAGDYTVQVRTKGPNGSIQQGSACFAQAFVKTVCPTPTKSPEPGKCEYSSVQARVKLPGISNEWQTELRGLSKGDVFDVAGFYNNSGNLIPDNRLKLVVVDPRGNRTIMSKNNQGYKTFRPGRYEVRVRIKGFTGETCTDTVYVYVDKEWSRPTPERR